GLRTGDAGGGLGESPSQRRRGGRGSAEHRTVRSARRRVSGGAVAGAADGRVPSGGDPARGDPEREWRDAAVGDSHGQGPHRPNGGQIRAGAHSGSAVPPGELRLPAGTRRRTTAARGRSAFRPLPTAWRRRSSRWSWSLWWSRGSIRTPYGYRPGRSALDAVGTARKRCWVNWTPDLGPL